MIGGGPKALFALQELHDRLPDGADVAVDVFDPAEPGGGAVWRPELPPALRMNSSAGAVDARFSGFGEALADWVARTHPEHAAETYVPRRLAGAYLREAFAALVESDRMTVRHVRRRITGLRGTGAPEGTATAAEAAPLAGREATGAPAPGARVTGCDAPEPAPELLDIRAHDEVLLATGHAGPPSDLHDRAGRVPAGSVAVIRGAALTGLDAVALLTEARGGAWVRTPGENPAGFLTYVPSGREPQRIRILSRSGTVMSPKPDGAHPRLVPAIERARADLRAQLRAREESISTPAGAGRGPASVGAGARPGTGRGSASSATGSPARALPRTAGRGAPLDLDALWRSVLGASENALAAHGIRTSPLRLWRTLLTGRPARDEAVWAGRQQALFLRTRIEIDAGLRPPDESWVLGRVWFELFPETLRLLDRARLLPRDRVRLNRVLAHQERASFGPSGLTARRLVALADAGLIEFASGSPAPSECIDAVTIGPGVVRAALPAAGARTATGTPDFLDPLFADLHARGLTTIRRGERGVLTAPDGTAIRPDGGRTEGLAVIGRPTEGPVLGNDTLDRTLHADGARWAAAAAERAALSSRR